MVGVHEVQDLTDKKELGNTAVCMGRYLKDAWKGLDPSNREFPAHTMSVCGGSGNPPTGASRSAFSAHANHL